jgi:hypothetical protein
MPTVSGNVLRRKAGDVFHLYGVGPGVILPLIELFPAVEPERL